MSSAQSQLAGLHHKKTSQFLVSPNQAREFFYSSLVEPNPPSLVASTATSSVATP
jgi:hypothetical protein